MLIPLKHLFGTNNDYDKVMCEKHTFMVRAHNDDEYLVLEPTQGDS